MHNPQFSCGVFAMSNVSTRANNLTSHGPMEIYPLRMLLAVLSDVLEICS